MTVESQANSGSLTARIEMPDRSTPKRLLVRFRHPDGKTIRSATVNGSNWAAFDAEKEWIVIEQPAAESYEIVARY